ncbi:hypothetical protein [Haloplanus salilacus]|uniref:hypothetical protein n=1 Tax=Haloplanus salilacus TaxID=2949994 RepID=UPI0030CD4E7D
MTRSAAGVVDQYDIDPAVVEALLARYGDVTLEPDADELTDRERLVREFFESGDEHPIRTGPDHYHQFERSEWVERPAAPGTEDEFQAALDAAVRRGIVARTDEDRPRYSSSYYDLLSELGGEFTASDIDELCETTGMPKRHVYYHVFTDLNLDVDLRA